MVPRHRVLACLVVPALLAQPLAAQSVEALLARGAELHANPQGALEVYQQVLALEPANYEANWRAAQALLDLGKQTPDSVKSAERDSLYAQAERYARAAVEANPDGADGHYILAAAIGRASLTKSKKERVRRAAEIRSEALRALELNPAHDKAYHVMGRWHAEIMRLSGLERFFAKTFLGGKIFGEASWDGAIRNLERATELAPEVIYHHLVLAEVLRDRQRYAEARIHLQQVLDLPLYDVMDPQYKRDAERLLGEIEGKPDRGTRSP
jgi:tetratricopeptide (TPR) repeat protein